MPWPLLVLLWEKRIGVEYLVVDYQFIVNTLFLSLLLEVSNLLGIKAIESNNQSAGHYEDCRHNNADDPLCWLCCLCHEIYTAFA